MQRSNQQVDTDAQGRPLGRCAPCAPLHGRRSHARYASQTREEHVQHSIRFRKK